MYHDEEPLDLLEDDGESVNKMCLLFDMDSENKGPQKSPQGTGCSLVLLVAGISIISVGLIFEIFFA